MTETATADLLQKASDIVAAYVSNNSVPPGELPSLLTAIHSTLTQIANGGLPAAAPEQAPAVSVRSSVKNDHIICLEDGHKFKSLRRHLASEHGMTPEEYRSKWKLPHDYPMVAPEYSATRSQLAKSSGLGRPAAGAEARPKRRRKA